MIRKFKSRVAARLILDWNTELHRVYTKLHRVCGRAAAPRDPKTAVTQTLRNSVRTSCNSVLQSDAHHKLRSNRFLPGPHQYFLAVIFFMTGLFTACTAEPPPSPVTTFYHWETELNPSPTARHLLDSFACDRLYVKAFDLNWRGGETEVSAMLEFGDTTGLPELIPVVFITNEVLVKTSQEEISGLAQSIISRLDKLFPSYYPELQIDCDWTARTRVGYFGFLSEVKRLRPNIMLTCTVRLHQYRDRREQGVPPVDRATLMAYNTGDLNDWNTKNSIYDSTVVKNYLAGQPDYPLDLDLAVAAYDWAAVYRNGELVYLINEPDLGELEDTARFGGGSELNAPRYYVKRSTYLNGTYLYSGDQLRREIVEPFLIPEQAELLQRYVKSFAGQRVMVFRLGSRLFPH